MQQSFEIIFNNGDIKQILILPEMPLKISLFFGEKELYLTKRMNSNNLYVISHQRGFVEEKSSDQQNIEGKSNKNMGESSQNDTGDALKHSTISSQRFGNGPKLILKKRQALSSSTFQKYAKLQRKHLKGNQRNDQSLPATSDKTSHPCNPQNAPVRTIVNAKPDGPCEKVVCLHPFSNSNKGKMLVQSSSTKSNIMGAGRLLASTQKKPEANATQSKSVAGKLECNTTQSHNAQINQNISASKEIGPEIQVVTFDLSSLVDETKLNNSIEGSRLIYARKVFGRCEACLKKKSELMKEGKKLHAFPLDPEMSDKWAKILNRKWILKVSPTIRNRRYHVCSHHFLPSDYASSKQVKMRSDAVPTQNLPNSSNVYNAGRITSQLSIDRNKEALTSQLHRQSVRKMVVQPSNTLGNQISMSKEQNNIVANTAESELSSAVKSIINITQSPNIQMNQDISSDDSMTIDIASDLSDDEDKTSPEEFSNISVANKEIKKSCNNEDRLQQGTSERKTDSTQRLENCSKIVCEDMSCHNTSKNCSGASFLFPNISNRLEKGTEKLTLKDEYVSNNNFQMEAFVNTSKKCLQRSTVPFSHIIKEEPLEN